MTRQLAGKRVLIVEDDNILAIGLADELARNGAKVKRAGGDRERRTRRDQ